MTTIPLADMDENDKVVWTKTKAGKYTVKSAYNQIWEPDTKQHTIQTSSSYQYPRELWTMFWNLNTHQKIKNFTWSLCHKAILTTDNLWKKKTVPKSLCPLCQQSPESVEHIFLLCKWTNEVWRHSDLQMKISY